MVPSVKIGKVSTPPIPKKELGLLMTSATRTSAKLQNEELKDAYRVWLKDLYDDKPERLLQKLDKKKSGGGRRARRNQRMQHAQQHTASAVKDVALKKTERDKLPAISLVHTSADKKVLQASQNRRHQALVDEANYSAFQYPHQPSWRPGLAFFQQLVRHILQKASPEMGCGNTSSEGVAMAELTGFPVLIAPILLRVPIRNGRRLGVALLFCLEQNQDQHRVVESNGNTTTFILRCCVYLRTSSWREHRNSLLDIVSNTSAEICSVRKCAENFESRNNNLLLLRSRKEVEKAMDELWVDSDDAETNYDTDLLAIQKYIAFKGSSTRSSTFTDIVTMTPSGERKAWIARCGSRKRDKNSSTIWIISGGDGCDNENLTSTAITNSSCSNCQIVKCTIDQAWSEPRLLASMCALPLEKALRIRFNELVVDLLQDPSGCWWLLQVKAFTLASKRPASAATVSSLSSSLSTKTSSVLSRTQSAPTRFEVGIVPTPQWKKWRCAGRYCASKNSCKNSSEPNQQIDDHIDGPDDDKEPCGYLTKKMLRSCEFYDDFVQQQDMSLASGFTEFRSALTFHLQHRLPKRDRSQLYEPQPLCSACIKRYHSLRQQWIETVEAPKTTITPNSKAGYRGKISHAKTYREHTEQILLPPRKLPSLHHEPVHPSVVTGSFSTPALLASNIGTCSSEQQDNATVSKQSNYLDELAAMEEMLEEHTPSILTKTKNKVQSPALIQTTTATSLSSLNTLPTKLSGPEDIFPKWDGVTRIEEMWQNLTFKPLERQLTNPVNDSGGMKQGYNSISLQQELAIVAKENDNNKENDQHTTPEPKLDNEEKHSAKNAVSVHGVHVQHCRRVFEDENYREDLVNDVLSAFRSGNSNVCFVVNPHNRNPKSTHDTGEDGNELAEMALRSLYIDVKQAIAGSSDNLSSNLSLSSWPMRPTLCREISGCITVKLGPV